MAGREAQQTHREVSPLELFFDLVFVLAVSQLTHHLLTHLTWRGAGETVVMLIGVYGVWAFTAFEVTLLDIEHRVTRAITIAVMCLGLFMNAGITHAFDDSPWLFVAPMVVALLVPAGYAAASAPAPHLREHFVRVTVWIAASAPFWLAGAAVEGRARLACWGAAATIDLVGTWTAHPGPRRSTETEGTPFDTDHLLERMRLFLIILLGESLLSLGKVVSTHHSDLLTLTMALGGFVVLVCLWAVYFGGAEELAVQHTSATPDPIRSVRIGINVLYGVFLGLVVLAAGTAELLAHAHAAHAGVAGVLTLVGPAIYLAAQAFYFRKEPGTGWRTRLVAAAALCAAASVAFWLPSAVVVALVVVLLVAAALVLSRREAHSTADIAD